MYEQSQQSGSQAQPPPYTPSPQPAQPNTPNNVSSKGVTYAIVAVVIVIVAGGIAFSLMDGSKSSNTIHNTTSTNKNSSNPSTPPNPLYSIISSNKSMSVKAFTQTLDSKFTNTNQLNVSYSGSLTANIKSNSSTQTSRLPLRIDLMKYNSNSRADVNISDIPLLGNLTLVYILNSGEMYTCAKISGFSSFGSNSSNVTPGYQCQPPVASSSLITLVAANSSLNSSIHFTSIKQSSYNGNGCVLTSGYMLINTNQSSNPSATGPLSIITGSLLPSNSRTNATFNMCLSNTYYVPLTITITEVRNASYLLTGSGTETVTMQLNETSLVTSVSPSITALPGPITNSSTSAGANTSASVP
jgi:hypothetical protein